MGLDIADRFDFDRFTLIYMRDPASSFELELTVNKGRTEPYQLGDGYGHLAVAVDDLEAARNRMIQASASPGDIKSLNREGALLARFFFVRDPDGYSIEVLQRHGRLQLTAYRNNGRGKMREIDRSTKVGRRILLRAGAVAVPAAALAGASISATAAWAEDAKHIQPKTMATLAKMARDIYPHDYIADVFYIRAVTPWDAKAGKDPAVKTMVEEGVTRLDAAAQDKHGSPYMQVGWEADRVALLQGMEDSKFFKALRADLVVSLYNQPEIWPKLRL